MMNNLCFQIYIKKKENIKIYNNNKLFFFLKRSDNPPTLIIVN